MCCNTTGNSFELKKKKLRQWTVFLGFMQFILKIHLFRRCLLPRSFCVILHLCSINIKSNNKKISREKDWEYSYHHKHPLEKDSLNAIYKIFSRFHFICQLAFFSYLFISICLHSFSCISFFFFYVFIASRNFSFFLEESENIVLKNELDFTQTQVPAAKDLFNTTLQKKANVSEYSV